MRLAFSGEGGGPASPGGEPAARDRLRWLIARALPVSVSLSLPAPLLCASRRSRVAVAEGKEGGTGNRAVYEPSLSEPSCPAQAQTAGIRGRGFSRGPTGRVNVGKMGQWAELCVVRGLSACVGMRNGPVTAHFFFFLTFFSSLLFSSLSFFFCLFLFFSFSLPSDNNFLCHLMPPCGLSHQQIPKNLKKKRPWKMRIAGIPRPHGIGSR